MPAIIKWYDKAMTDANPDYELCGRIHGQYVDIMGDHDFVNGECVAPTNWWIDLAGVTVARGFKHRKQAYVWARKNLTSPQDAIARLADAAKGHEYAN